jgi:hypothetical protein
MATRCQVCGADAASKKTLKRHMELRHPEEKKKKRGKYAMRPYNKRTVVVKPTILPPPVVAGPSEVSKKDCAVELLLALADSFQGKADLLRIMASDLARIRGQI